MAWKTAIQIADTFIRKQHILIDIVINNTITKCRAVFHGVY